MGFLVLPACRSWPSIWPQAADGDEWTSSSTYVMQNPWLLLTLDRPYFDIKMVTMLSGNDASWDTLSGVTVTLSVVPNPFDNVGFRYTCAENLQASSQRQRIDVDCSGRPVTRSFQYVFIQRFAAGNTQLSIAEVQVFRGGELLAAPGLDALMQRGVQCQPPSAVYHQQRWSYQLQPYRCWHRGSAATPGC